MVKSLLPGVLCCLFLHTGHAQMLEIKDSLRSVYEADTLTAEAKMDLLNQLAYYESQIPDPLNQELALQYAEELIALARETGNSEKLGAGYLQKGNALITQRNLSEALDAYLSSASTFDAIPSKKGQGISYYSLAFTYVESGDTDKAEEWYRKSLEILRDPELLTSEGGLTQLASALFNAGEFYLEQGDYTTAESHFLEAREIFQQQPSKTGYYYALGNIGVLYLKRGDLEKAEQNLSTAIDWLEKDGDYTAASDFQAYMAELYRERQAYQKAHQYAQRSLEHAQRLGLKDQISKSSLLLAGIDQELANYKEANLHLNLHMQYQDSMDVETVDMARFQLERTEREKAELLAANLKGELQLANQELTQKRQRTFLWATGATILLLIMFVVGGYRRYRYIKQTNQIISDEKDRSEALLLNILPKKTAQELKENGRVKAQRFNAVTVLFTDFQGFTRHAESLDPENLIRSLDHYFGHFDSIMEKHGLEKIKTVGDAYMCASGLPFPDERHAVKVVDAALEMMAFVEASKTDPENTHIRFDMRIGINSGPVVAGVVGTKKFAYDIWGDTVNIASRMESTSDIGRINVAEGTYQLIKDVYECEFRGKIDVKNRGKLNMYFVLGRRSGQRIPETASRAQA